MKNDTHFQDEIDKLLRKNAQSRFDWSDGDPDPLSNPQDLSVLEGDEREGVKSELEYEELDLNNLLSKLEKMYDEAEKNPSQETLLQYLGLIDEINLESLIEREHLDKDFSVLLELDKNIENELFERGNLHSENVDVGYYIYSMTSALDGAIKNLKRELQDVESNVGMEDPMGAEIEEIESPEHYLGKSEQESKYDESAEEFGESFRNTERGSYQERWALKVLEELEKIASRLDSEGKYEDADAIERAMVRLAQETHLDSNGTTWINKGPSPFPKGYVTWVSSDSGTSMNLKPGEFPEPSSHTRTTTPTESPVAPVQPPATEPQSAANVGKQIGSWFTSKMGDPSS